MQLKVLPLALLALSPMSVHARTGPMEILDNADADTLRMSRDLVAEIGNQPDASIIPLDN